MPIGLRPATSARLGRGWRACPAARRPDQSAGTNHGPPGRHEQVSARTDGSRKRCEERRRRRQVDRPRPMRSTRTSDACHGRSPNWTSHRTGPTEHTWRPLGGAGPVRCGSRSAFPRGAALASDESAQSRRGTLHESTGFVGGCRTNHSRWDRASRPARSGSENGRRPPDRRHCAARLPPHPY